MTEHEQGRQRNRRRVWLALAVLVAILAVLIVPPLLSLNHYKNQITSLMASSLGRPVRLSSVHARLLPRPGFVLYDLVVDEDPAFGSEPVLHANTVTASLRILSLWRGRLEISRIGVDEASMNLVRTADGRWNLDPLVQTAAARAGTAATRGGVHVAQFPYLAATNSRVNFKNGIEKLPFSIIDTDLSFWQEEPGQWRLRLRGQPARTDVSLELADTGVVELNMTARRTPELRQMPVQLDLDWRDAQLGQLSRLLTGSDAGWRGDLRGEVHMEGTAEAAQIKTRLRATGVHRAEFEPVAAMDFDANCSLVYHYSQRALENLLCDSPLGDGRIRVAGDVPGNGGLPHYAVEMDRVPVAASLDALRTFRSGVDPSLVAAGTISGKINYAESAPRPLAQKATDGRSVHSAKASAAKGGQAVAAALTGSFTVDGLQLSGGGLSQPIQTPRIVLEAAPTQGDSEVLAGSVAIPAGATVPLTVNMRLGLKSYQVTVKGQASVARGRELAHAAGLSEAAALDSLAGDPLTIDLSAAGPWLPHEEVPFTETQPARAASGAVSGLVAMAGGNDAGNPTVDSLSGTVTLHNANWKADYLANHLQIADATLHVNNGNIRWEPVDFSYGPLKGTASVTVPKPCATREPCPDQTLPMVKLKFGELDAETVQSAILGAHAKGTLLSSLINRFHPPSTPVWPRVDGVVTADSFVVGPVKLQNAAVELHILPTEVEISGIDAKLLGGTVHGAGTLVTGDKPAYTLTGDLEQLNPVAVGQLLGESWRGGTFNATGKIALAGFTGDDLAGSAQGTLHFEWRHGSVCSAALKHAPATAAQGPPAVLAHFDRWTADAAIAGGKITLGQNEVAQGSRKQGVQGAVTLSKPAKASFAVPTPAKAQTKKR